MRKLLLAWSLLLAGIICLSLQPQPRAYWQSRDSTYNNPPSSGFQGPGNVVASATSWWGLRAYNSTLASSGTSITPVVDVAGASSGACTVYLKGDGTGGLDLTTSGAGGVGHACASGATTFCTITNASCTVSKLYDQVGTNHFVQATGANQPGFSLTGGSGSLPMISFSTTALFLSVASFSTTVPQTFSVSHVIDKLDGSSRDMLRSTASVAIVGYGQAGGNTYTPFAGSFLNLAAADLSYHAIQTVFSSSSSAVMIDGVDNTSLNPGTNGFATSADTVILNDQPASTSFTFRFEEVGVWPTGFSSGQRTSMNANQRAYWGF